MTDNRGEVVGYFTKRGQFYGSASTLPAADKDAEPLVPQSLLLAAREECELLANSIPHEKEKAYSRGYWAATKKYRTSAANKRANKAEAELARLRSAIQQHKDKFPDEPLDGELTLWAAIDACVGGGEGVMGWQPIETAPKDTPVLVSPTKRMGICVAVLTDRDGWQVETPHDWAGIYTPTHWQPLPEPPP